MSVVSTINVEVAYAEPDRQRIFSVNVDAGTTAGGAIVQSGIMMEFPDLDIENSKIGIFGKVSTMETIVREGDRIEIYRPLIADPKEVRRKRAAEKSDRESDGQNSSQKKITPKV